MIRAEFSHADRVLSIRSSSLETAPDRPHLAGDGPRPVNGAANLGVHRPFGGVGLSGFGKEGGRAGLEEFLQVKSVAIV